MISLVQFGINKHLYIFRIPQIALALRARTILLVFEKFTRAYLFQIALEIMCLPIQSESSLHLILCDCMHLLVEDQLVLNLLLRLFNFSFSYSKSGLWQKLIMK